MYDRRSLERYGGGQKLRRGNNGAVSERQGLLPMSDDGDAHFPATKSYGFPAVANENIEAAALDPCARVQHGIRPVIRSRALHTNHRAERQHVWICRDNPVTHANAGGGRGAMAVRRRDEPHLPGSWCGRRLRTPPSMCSTALSE